MTMETALTICTDRFMSEAEVRELCAALDGPESESLNPVSVTVAKRYLAGDLSYEIADTFMNSVWGYSLKLEKIPDLMYSIYLEFDAGEYHHSGDPDHVDPELKYTKPGLARILSAVEAT